MMKRLLMITVLLTIGNSLCRAQTTDTNGIHFEQQLKWSEILAKAKAEHRYIFVDCYATWCGPCKLMEQRVYPQKAVGEAYKDFICVKVQMDKTANDDSLTKSRYSRAEMLEKSYDVNAYPTFLFFDADGNPVHKVTGTLDVEGFIQMAMDAQNTNKQYYAMLKNFQPGKLDTADEKGLPLVFLNSDKILASRIAADYLTRIPKKRLNTYDNCRLMFLFQDDPQVSAIATEYIASLGKNNYTKKANADFIVALSQQQNIMDIALNYIHGLSFSEIGQPDDLAFIERFRDDLQVQQFALRYIDTLPESRLFNKPMIGFMNTFTQTTKDKAFQLYSTNVARIDTIMKAKGLAEHSLAVWIDNTAKVSGVPPDFEGIAHTLAKKCGTARAQITIIDAKVGWYDYLVHEKKQEKNWPQLIKASFERDQQYLTDPAISSTWVNNDCYEAFLHSGDTIVLHQAALLMAKVTGQGNENNDQLDTYACILYKLGQTSQAISIEENILKHFDNITHPVIAGQYRSKIEAMKRGGKIWLEPEFQD